MVPRVGLRSTKSLSIHGRPGESDPALLLATMTGWRPRSAGEGREERGESGSRGRSGDSISRLRRYYSSSTIVVSCRISPRKREICICPSWHDIAPVHPPIGWRKTTTHVLARRRISSQSPESHLRSFAAYNTVVHTCSACPASVRRAIVETSPKRSWPATIPPYGAQRVRGAPTPNTFKSSGREAAQNCRSDPPKKTKHPRRTRAEERDERRHGTRSMLTCQ